MDGTEATPDEEEQDMRRVVVESPYAADSDVRKARYAEYARRALADALYRDEAPLASHVLYAQSGALDDDVPQERALGILAGMTWAALAEVTVIYTDYGISPGMADAITEALNRGQRVEYRTIGRNP